MGLIIASLVAGMAWAALWWSRRLTRASLQLAAAALLAGLAGYALHGQAGLVGSPASQRAPAPLPPVIPVEVATAFFGRFNGAYSWLVIANSYMARGDSGNAVAAMESGLRARPRDPELWIGLGNALTTHAGGGMSPAARLAFERAMTVAPEHPGPSFFYGAALLTQGEVETTIELWRRAIELAPPNAPWRDGLAARIAVLQRMRAEPPNGPALR